MIPQELENKIDSVTHVRVLVHASCSTNIISWSRLFSVAFPKAFGNLGRPPVGTQKYFAHIKNVNKTLIILNYVCLCSCSSWSVSSLNGKGNVSFISHFPVTWHIHGHQEMCLNEGEGRQTVLQTGLCSSALCQHAPPPSSLSREQDLRHLSQHHSLKPETILTSTE